MTAGLQSGVCRGQGAAGGLGAPTRGRKKQAGTPLLQTRWEGGPLARWGEMRLQSQTRVPGPGRLGGGHLRTNRLQRPC